MAESTGPGVPHGAWGMENPEVECACTGTVRRAMCPRRCRCCPSTVAVPVPPWKIMDDGGPSSSSTPSNRIVQPMLPFHGKDPFASALPPLIFRHCSWVPQLFDVRPRAGSAGIACARPGLRERFTPAGCLIAADLPRAADWTMFGGRGNYGSNPVSLAWSFPHVPLMRRRARDQPDGTLSPRFRAGRVLSLSRTVAGGLLRVFLGKDMADVIPGKYQSGTCRVPVGDHSSIVPHRYLPPSTPLLVLAWLSMSTPGSRGIPSAPNRHSSACHVP